MGWKDAKNIGDVIDASEWTNQANTLELISGSYYGHSSNSTIHYPSSNLRNWMDGVYAPSGTSGEPSAPINSIQFNEAGAFGGDPELSWDTSLKRLIISGMIRVSGSISGTNISGGSINIGPSTKITSILDEDTLVSDLDTALATQQSIRAYVNTISSNLDTKIDNLNGTYAPSAMTKSGFASVSSASKIAHGLGSLPSYVNVTPSGNVNFGTSCTVDTTNITVNLTAGGIRDVYWFVSK